MTFNTSVPVSFTVLSSLLKGSVLSPPKFGNLHIGLAQARHHRYAFDYRYMKHIVKPS